MSYANTQLIKKIHNTSPSELKQLGPILNDYNLNKNDLIIMPFRGYYLDVFYNTQNTNFISFDINYSFKTNDKNTLEKILDKQYIENTGIEPHQRFKTYICSERPSKQLDEYINKNVSKLKTNAKVLLIIYNYSKFPERTKIINNITQYNKLPIFKLLLTKINYDLITILNENLQLKTIVDKKYIKIYVFEKK